MSEGPAEILLVEDNPDDVELTMRAFARHRLANQVHVAADGVEALDFMFGTEEQPGPGIAHPPHVILLDLKLPLVNGLEVLERLKADPRTHDIPVVVLTSSREDPDIAECYRLGANSYIVKPVDFDQFTEAVRQVGLYWVLLNQPPGS